MQSLMPKLGGLAMLCLLVIGCGGSNPSPTSTSDRYSNIEAVLSRIVKINSRRSPSQRSSAFVALAKKPVYAPGIAQTRTEEEPPPTSLKDLYKVGDRIIDEVYQTPAIVEAWDIAEDPRFNGEYVQRRKFRYYTDETYTEAIATIEGGTTKEADGAWTFSQDTETFGKSWFGIIRSSFRNTSNFETQEFSLTSEAETEEFASTFTNITRNGVASASGSMLEKASGTRVTWTMTYDNETGAYRSLFEDSSGYSIEWMQNSDGSGSFTIRNPADPLTPAVGTFDSTGKGIIRFADGSEEPFDLYDGIFG